MNRNLRALNSKGEAYAKGWERIFGHSKKKSKKKKKR